MRRYAFLREPAKVPGGPVYKVMLCEAPEGVYLFGYARPEDVLSSSDLLYDSLESLYADWDDRIDARGWTDLPDPPPGGQQDAFLPLRVRGRGSGAPEWGSYEILRDGVWEDWRQDRT